MATSADTDRHFMERALELAERGRGTTSPNPMVGAVVVRDGEIVGEGWHIRAGGDHAEVMALNEAGDRARGATVYVTLEPCCHHGKTPPCTEALIASGVRRVVAAMLDDNPVVCGGGCTSLTGHGIDVVSGVLEDRARRLNEAYLTFITTGRPFVTLKLAVTLDGRIADGAGASKWITGAEARAHVHRLRSWSDAVMVGAGTVRADDPSLTVRDAEGRDPLRVVIDSCGSLGPAYRVFDGGGTVLALAEPTDEERAAEFARRDVGVITAGTGHGGVDIARVLGELGARNITSVLCEGGAKLASSLLRAGLVDKVVVFVAPKLLGCGIPALNDIGAGCIGEALRLTDVEVRTFGDDTMISGYPVYGN